MSYSLFYLFLGLAETLHILKAAIGTPEGNLHKCQSFALASGNSWKISKGQGRSVVILGNCMDLGLSEAFGTKSEQGAL